MLKKIITLGVVTAVVLIGIENVIAQEGTDGPEQIPRRRQGREGRPRPRSQARQFSGQQQKDSEAPAKGAETDRNIDAMRKKHQQTLAQKGTPRDRMGRRLRQSRPRRNQPVQRLFGGRGRRFQGRTMGGWGRGYQCGALCPCCQRGICPWYEDFSGRGMRGWGRGFQGSGMMGRGSPGYRGRGMMGRGGRGFQGRGMGGWGQGFQPRGMGRPDPGIPTTPEERPFPQKSPEEDVLKPTPPMQRRGMMGRGGRGFQGRGMGRWDQGFQPQDMGRPGAGMSPTPDVRPFPQNPPEEDVLVPAPPRQRRGIMGGPGQGFRGRGMGWDFPGPRGPEPEPENN